RSDESAASQHNRRDDQVGNRVAQAHEPARHVARHLLNVPLSLHAAPRLLLNRRARKKAAQGVSRRNLRLVGHLYLLLYPHGGSVIAAFLSDAAYRQRSRPRRGGGSPRLPSQTWSGSPARAGAWGKGPS